MRLATRMSHAHSSRQLLQSSICAVPARPVNGSRRSSALGQRSSVALKANPYDESNLWTPYPPDNPDLVDQVEGPTPAKDPPTFSEVMGFSGAPEIVNGRLAMMGFVSALAAEYATGKSVPQQISQAPVPIVFAALTFVGASLVAAFAQKRGTKPISYGPFTPEAETLNARVGMLGFTLLIGLELSRGAALLSGGSS